MARNMKMELLTFYLILYQSKNCGHRIHILFMMYDVYWYCQMKKKRMIMKILKKEWFIWKFWKKGRGGVVEKRGEEETKSMPHAPVIKIGKSFKLKNYKYKTVLFRSSCMFKRCRFTHKHYINVLRFINFNPILPFKLIANMNIGLFYNWQNRFVKGALATILTKKIICFGNW